MRPGITEHSRFELIMKAAKLARLTHNPINRKTTPATHIKNCIEAVKADGLRRP